MPTWNMVAFMLQFCLQFLLQYTTRITRISVRLRECTRSRRARVWCKSIYLRHCACGRGVARSRRIYRGLYYRASNRNQSQLCCAVPAALPVAVVAGPHPDDATRPMSNFSGHFSFYYWSYCSLVRNKQIMWSRSLPFICLC